MTDNIESTEVEETYETNAEGVAYSSESAPSADQPLRAATIAPAATPAWLPVYSLARRELVRFFRQRTRVVGALGQPLIFWIIKLFLTGV